MSVIIDRKVNSVLNIYDDKYDVMLNYLQEEHKLHNCLHDYKSTHYSYLYSLILHNIAIPACRTIQHNKIGQYLYNLLSYIQAEFLNQEGIFRPIMSTKKRPLSD